jgi:hypothetical protein
MRRVEREQVRAYVLEREKSNNIVRVRFMEGDVRAYTSDGDRYWVAPIAELLKEMAGAEPNN